MKNIRVNTKVWSLAVLFASGLLFGCVQEGRVVITSHASPVFTTASSVVVAGGVSGVTAAQVLSVNVNGVPTTLDANLQFSVSVPLDAAPIIVPVVAEVQTVRGTLRDRVTFVVANGTTTNFVADGDLSRRAVGLRISKRGLDEVEKQATSILPIDVASIIPNGTRLVSDQCVVKIWFVCVTRLDVDVQDPPAAFQNVDVDLTPNNGSVRADIDISGLQLNAIARTKSLHVIPINCRLTVDLDSVSIGGDYRLSPDAARRRFVDVVQVATPSSAFSGLSYRFTSGLCSIPLIQPIINALLPDIQSLFNDGFGRILADPDGAGPQDAPVAAAIEGGLAMVEIDGAVGRSIGVNLEAPMDAVLEDTGGVTIVSDLRVTASNPDPMAFDQPASFEVAQAFPTFGDTTPSGQPYDIAIAIGASGFNQLLKAEIESGVLRGSVTSLVFFPGGPQVPLTAGLLTTFFPQLAALPADRPLILEVLPTAAPIIVGNPGANGELAELRIGGLKTLIRTNDAAAGTIFEIEADVPVAIDLAFGPDGVTFSFTNPLPQDTQIEVVQNPFLIDEVALKNLAPVFLPAVLPEVTASLSSFPIPDLLGFQFTNVEIARLGEFFALFGDLR